jgi:ribosomal protein S27E
MALLCDNCKRGRVVYENANESHCEYCGETYPNAHLNRLEVVESGEIE